MNRRLNYIDIARAFAIIIVVLSYALSAATHNFELYKILFSINVPLFFVLSGFTFSVKNEETFWQFLKRKFIRIMIPYFIWALLFLIPYFMFGQNVSTDLSQNPSFDFGQILGNTFYGNGFASAIKQNSPLWFLPALFTTEILYYFIVKLCKTRRCQLVALPIIIVVGFLFSLLPKNIQLPWGINSALQIGGFFYCGFLMKSQNLLEKHSKTFNIISTLVALTLGMVAFCFNINDQVVWFSYMYGYYFLSMVSGIAFSYVIIKLSQLINKNRLLEYVGRNTMGILIFHKIIIVVLQTKLGGFSSQLTDSSICTELILALVSVVIAVVVSLGISYIVRKIAPWSLGEKRVSSSSSKNS